MAIKRYNAKNCPCPADCIRHGKCKLCIEFHHGKGEQTYCEYMYDKQSGEPENDASVEEDEDTFPSGKEIRLLDYAPCAG